MRRGKSTSGAPKWNRSSRSSGRTSNSPSATSKWSRKMPSCGNNFSMPQTTPQEPAHRRSESHLGTGGQQHRQPPRQPYHNRQRYRRRRENRHGSGQRKRRGGYSLPRRKPLLRRHPHRERQFKHQLYAARARIFRIPTMGRTTIGNGLSRRYPPSCLLQKRRPGGDKRLFLSLPGGHPRRTSERNIQLCRRTII